MDLKERWTVDGNENESCYLFMFNKCIFGFWGENAEVSSVCFCVVGEVYRSSQSRKA